MTTVIFVHGTGSRDPHFTETFEEVKRELQRRRPGLEVIPCYWGETLGSSLRRAGASIPFYDSTKGIEGIPEDMSELVLWRMLAQDPLYELRTLAVRSNAEEEFVPGRVTPGERLREEVARWFPSAVVQAQLKQGGVAEMLSQGRKEVTESTAYLELLIAVSEPLNPYRTAIARAFVASAGGLAAVEAGTDAVGDNPELTTHYVRAMADPILRDELVAAIASELGPSDKGLVEWAGKQLWGLAVRLGAMNRVQRKRGAITDAVYPFAGDILLYQARGEKIRRFIHGLVEQAAENGSDVVLLAHSLGGVACVDLLVSKTLPAVKLLVTIGSQAPFLYEIGALSSLDINAGEELPLTVPRWLNIYDLRDFLSYIGANVFPDRVEDVAVDNGLAFPDSHGGYWANKEVWDAVLERLPA